MRNNITGAFEKSDIADAKIFFRTSSKLWRVAREIVTPSSATGSSSATGVITPVLPTWNVMPIILRVLAGQEICMRLPTVDDVRLLPITGRWTENLVLSRQYHPFQKDNRVERAPHFCGLDDFFKSFTRNSKRRCGKIQAVEEPSPIPLGKGMIPFVYRQIFQTHKMKSGLLAVMLVSSWRREPAAHCADWQIPILHFHGDLHWGVQNLLCHDDFSPNVNISLSGIVRGMLWIVLRFSVMSSPISPFPRVAPLKKLSIFIVKRYA